MGHPSQQAAKRTTCAECPLCTLEDFRKFTKPELAFITDFKTGELTADKGATVLQEGSHSAHLFTVLSGWGFRYKILEDGRRQILNYVVPGDLVGLQGTLLGEMQHSVEALTPMGRLAEPLEVAHAMLFLASDAASMVTGHTLAVDGGFLAQ